jgi:heat shock protein HslJ
MTEERKGNLRRLRDRLKVVRAHLAVPLALLLLAGPLGCGDDGGGGGGGDGADLDAELDGRELVATGITEDGVRREPVAGTEIRLTFDDGQLGATAGCNSMGGRYALDGDVLVVDELATTDMACEPPLMAQDEWLAGLLAGRPSVGLDGTDVTLTTGSTVVKLTDRQVVRPDAPLVGTVWVLDTIFEGGPDGAASSVPDGVEASVTFGDDGTYSIATGCNVGSGDYEQTGPDTLRLAQPLVSLSPCEPDQAVAEGAMLSLFAPGDVEAVVDDQRLTLTAGDAGLGFRAAP